MEKAVMLSAYTPLNLCEIRPEGWLKQQLMVQKQGLTGHLEEIWPDVGSNSGWLGGSGEAWERGPYYLDGLIPLAYLLDDSSLKEKAQKWIEWILESQKDNGLFGPDRCTDWWPRTVALKAICQYHSATNDSRVLSFLLRYFTYMHTHLDAQPFEMWATARGEETLLPLYYLYSRQPEPQLIALAEKITSYSTPWETIFSQFPFPEKTGHYLNRPLFLLVKRLNLLKARFFKSSTSQGGLKPKTAAQIKKNNASPQLQAFHHTHSVNLAMALKMPALRALFTGDKALLSVAKKGLTALNTYHGLKNGLFSGDEHLNGSSPTSGAELCLVVELMFSLEQLYAITASPTFADHLEQVAYNALPATFTQDMCAHQYVQQVNQVLVTKARREWYDAYDEANLFGLEPNFGCCTANMHQGWPKLAASTWFKTQTGGLAAGIYAPCRISTRLAQTLVLLQEETNYPFNNHIILRIEKIDNSSNTLHFPLELRIPGWATSFTLTLNGEPYTASSGSPTIVLERDFCQGDCIELILDMPPRRENHPDGSQTIHRGALQFALPLPYTTTIVRGQIPFADMEFRPTVPWNFGIYTDEEIPIEASEHSLGCYPFGEDQPAVTLQVPCVQFEEWKLTKNSSGPLPRAKTVMPQQVIARTFVPYGNTRLRVAQFPAAHPACESAKENKL